MEARQYLIACEKENINEISKIVVELKDRVRFHEESKNFDLPLPESSEANLRKLIGTNPSTSHFICESSCIEIRDVCFRENEDLSAVIAAFDKLESGSGATLRVIVAFTSDRGESVKFIEHKLQGKIVFSDFDGTIKDSFFPLQHEKSLTSMNNFAFVVSPRFLCYMQAIDQMRGWSYTGVFEVHITVGAPFPTEGQGSEAENHFRETCAAIHCKPVLIHLPNGVPSQMMTSSYSNGTFDNAFQYAQKVSNELSMRNYNLTRVKVEAMMANAGIPESSADTFCNYFEFHVKVEYSTKDADIENKLKAICHRNNAHLSRNAFKIFAESDLAHRFLTMRVYKEGKSDAMARYKACVKAVKDCGLKIVTKQREFSVYDSNIELDRGWIPLH